MEKDDKINAKGPIGKFFSENALLEIMKKQMLNIGDTIFMSCGNKNEVEKILSNARNKIANELNLIDENVFSFCWIVDYPMFEIDENTKKDQI